MRIHHFKNLYRYRYVMLAIMGVIYFLACFHRVAPTVIARDLMLEFGADATALGLMSSAYFYLYAAIQPPVGMWSDTMGPRRVITIFTLIASAGTILFALAANMPMAAMGRALIGIGAGGIFVPGLKIFSMWYRAKEFAGVTGIFLAMGNAGNLSASLPLTFLVLLLGWRLSFIGVGAFSLLLAAVGWMILRDRPNDKGWNDSVITGDDPSPPSEPTPHGMTFHKRFRIVLGHPSFWMITLSYFFYGGPTLTFQGLWAVPYLMDVHGFSRVQAGGLLMFVPLGLIVGAPGIGYLADRFPMGRTRILTLSLCLPLLCWFFFFVSGGKSNPTLLTPTFFCNGVLWRRVAITLYDHAQRAIPFLVDRDGHGAHESRGVPGGGPVPALHRLFDGCGRRLRIDLSSGGLSSGLWRLSCLNDRCVGISHLPDGQTNESTGTLIERLT